MLIMSFNILNGGEDRFPLILDAVRTIKPDILAIQEANSFPDHDHARFHEIVTAAGLPYYDYSPAGELSYHVATFSALPFETVQRLGGFRNAGLVTRIRTAMGTVAVGNAHLTPLSEDARLLEQRTLLQALAPDALAVIVGDMNSLSRLDGYPDTLIASFNRKQLEKFTRDGKLRYDVTDAFTAAGYTDTAALFPRTRRMTVPTPACPDDAHGNFRLDYGWVSPGMKSHVTACQVVVSPVTNRASDHYPLTVTLSY